MLDDAQGILDSLAINIQGFVDHCGLNLNVSGYSVQEKK